MIDTTQTDSIERSRKQQGKRLLWFLLFSLLFHFVFFVVIPLHPPKPKVQELAPLDVTLIMKARIADIQPPKKEILKGT